MPTSCRGSAYRILAPVGWLALSLLLLASGPRAADLELVLDAGR